MSANAQRHKGEKKKLEALKENCVRELKEREKELATERKSRKAEKKALTTELSARG